MISTEQGSGQNDVRPSGVRKSRATRSRGKAKGSNAGWIALTSIAAAVIAGVVGCVVYSWEWNADGNTSRAENDPQVNNDYYFNP